MSVSALRALLVRHAAQASVVAFCALLIAGLWSGLALQMRSERQAIIEAAHREDGNYARILDEHVTQTLHAVEIVLNEIETEYRRLGERLDLVRLANELHVSADPYLSLAVVDDKGDLRRANYAIDGRPNFKDRENYRFHAAHDTPATFISRPRQATSGPISGRWAIIVSRRMSRPAGRFAGYVSVAIDPFYFSQLYDQLDLGRDSVLTLFGRDGVIRARKENDQLSAGQDVSGSALFQSIVHSSGEGQLVGRGQLAAMTRLYNYRAVKDYPLYVLVGRSEQAVLSRYAARRDAYVRWAGVATLLSALFAALLVYLIGHRARSEARVRESEQRYLDLVEHASDGIFIADARQRYIQVNQAGCRMLGYTEEELLAMSMSDLVTEEDQRRQPFRIDELRAGKAVLVERRLRRKDGVLVPVEISARMLANGLQQAIVRDISERKAAEERLRQSDTLFREIGANIPEFLWVRDAKTDALLYVNPGWERITGRKAEIGKDFRRTFASALPDDLERLRQAAARASQGGLDEVVRVRHADGSIRWVYLRSFPIRNEAGEVYRVAGVGEDITERKRAEEELKRLNTELEARVEARTAELRQSLDELRAAQARLVQSEKMAALGSLVAGVAHEINTPLGIGVTAASHVDLAVRGLNQRFAAGQLTRQEMEGFLSNAAEACEMVLANLQRAADLIRSFKQVAVDQSSGERRRFALRPYLEEVLRSLGPQLRSTRHEVLLDCPEDLELHSYPGAYSQIVTNLVLNSLTHGFEDIEQGRIEIEVRREGESLRLQYRDNGQGIAPEHLPKIFDPFFTTKRGLGGSGLGLHVLYNLVTQTLGGTIECRSKPGEGVSFEIELPMRPPAQAAA